MPSLVSHQLSIIKYVVLKKIFFLSLFWPSHLDLDLDLDSNLFGLGLDLDSNLFGLGLDLDSNLFGLGLDLDSNLFGLGLALDSTKVDLTTALTHTHTPGAVGTHTHLEQWAHTHTHLEQWKTHTHTHAPGAVGSQRCGARGAVGGSVPCSRVSLQSWTVSCRSREPTTSDYKSNALSIRPRLHLDYNLQLYCVTSHTVWLSEK